jgi:hypothetical protein
MVRILKKIAVVPVPKHYTIKVYRIHEGKASSILNLGPRWRSVDSFMLRPL